MLSRTQAGSGKTVKQEQEEISRNHVQTFICLSVQDSPDVEEDWDARLELSDVPPLLLARSDRTAPLHPRRHFALLLLLPLNLKWAGSDFLMSSAVTVTHYRYVKKVKG